MYAYVYLCAIDPIRHAIDIRANSGSFWFTLLEAAVRGQHYQGAGCKNARQLNRSTLLKLAIQLKIAIINEAALTAGLSRRVLKPTILGFKRLKISKSPISVFFLDFKKSKFQCFFKFFFLHLCNDMQLCWNCDLWRSHGRIFVFVL